MKVWNTQAHEKVLREKKEKQKWIKEQQKWFEEMFNRKNNRTDNASVFETSKTSTCYDMNKF